MASGDRGADLIIYRMGLSLAPTITEQETVVEQFSPGINKRILRPSARQGLSIIDQLRKTRARFQGLTEENLARLATSRYLTDIITRSFTQRGSRQERLGNDLGLAFHTDALASAFSVFDVITRTELIALSGGTDAVVTRDTNAVEQITGQAPNLSDQVNKFFAESDLYARALTLLREDPTGRLLIAEAAKGVRNETTRYGRQPGLNSLIELFINYGSVLAEQAYDRTHRLNEILRP